MPPTAPPTPRSARRRKRAAGAHRKGVQKRNAGPVGPAISGFFSEALSGAEAGAERGRELALRGEVRLRVRSDLAKETDGSAHLRDDATNAARSDAGKEATLGASFDHAGERGRDRRERRRLEDDLAVRSEEHTSEL